MKRSSPDYITTFRQAVREAAGLAGIIGLQDTAEYLHFLAADDYSAPEYRAEISPKSQPEKTLTEPRKCGIIGMIMRHKSR